MVIGNEYLFDDIFQARDYILELEQKTLANDPYRKSPPVTIPFFDFNRPISVNSLEYPSVVYFNNAEESKFIMNRLMSGRYSLKPNLKNRKFLFRGETEFHNPCKPSLFRDAGKNYFLDSIIHGDEMYCLILSHPLVQLLDLGIMLNGKHVRFEMNLYGLIQHYYNQSALLDLTSDINVALFFATQNYDWKTDMYSPIIDEEHKYGILYYYAIDSIRDFQRKPNGEQLSTIGLQVFPRSGKQRGFLYECNKDTNFNEHPQLAAFRFRHNAKIAKEIYNQMAGGKQLFPYDILKSHWKNIARDKNTVSIDAVRLNLTRNEEETLDSILKKLKNDYNIKVDDYKPVLTVPELHEYYEAVKNENFWEEFCNQIHIPGDTDGKMMAALLDIPNQPEYEWAFKEGVPHIIDYNKGYLLRKYKHVIA